MLAVSPGAGETALSCAWPYKLHNMKAESHAPRTAEILRHFPRPPTPPRPGTWRKRKRALGARMRNRILNGSIPLCGYQRTHIRKGGRALAASRILPAGQRNPEDRSALGGAFHHNLTAMILNNLLHHCQSQSSAVFLAIADKGMKEALLNRLGNAGTVIGDRNRNGASDFGGGDFHCASPRGCGLTRVQQEVVQHTLQFALVKPSGKLIVAQDVDRSVVMTGMQANCLCGALDRFRNIGVGGA